MFRTGWLEGTLVVTVYRHHSGDSEYRVIWKGRVVGCKWTGDSTATITSDSGYTLLKRAGLRRMYQVSCPHVLYDVNTCRLSESSYVITSTISFISGNELSIRGLSNFGDGYFTGGKLKVGNNLMMIVRHVGNSVYMIDALDGADLEDEVNVWPGCDRSMTTCTSKFNNTLNFGGLPYIPTKNPFSGDALI